MAKGPGDRREYGDNERDPPFYAFLFFHVFEIVKRMN